MRVKQEIKTNEYNTSTELLSEVSICNIIFKLKIISRTFKDILERTHKWGEVSNVLTRLTYYLDIEYQTTDALLKW